MKKLVIAGFGIALLAIAAYAIFPLFNNKTLNETLPGLDGSTSPATSTDSETTEMSESFPIVDTIAHPAEGSVRIIESAGTTYVRFEDFHTINGPNVHVYLTNDLDAQEYIDLGPMKATDGNINYQVPADIDISHYRYVMHWCIPFDVLFNYAEINPVAGE